MIPVPEKIFQIGVKDFEHIKIIAAHIRMILNLKEVRSTRCISKVCDGKIVISLLRTNGPTWNLIIFKPKTELNQEYLLRKSQSGPLSDRYTMEKVKIDHSHEGLWSKTVMINKNEL